MHLTISRTTYSRLRAAIPAGGGASRRMRDTRHSFMPGRIADHLRRGGSLSTESYSIRQANFCKDFLYTYKAVIRRVIDGDTFIARIDLGFRTWITQTLRLRTIDVAELTSAAGRKAALHVRKLLSKCPVVVVKTYREEKYGRYLIDLFYKLRETEPEIILKDGIYLNQELLDKRIGERY